MKFVILATMATVAVAAPQYNYFVPPEESSEEIEVVPVHYNPQFADSSEEVEVVPILRDDRVHEEDGRFNTEVETGNGIRLSQSGTPNDYNGAVNMAGLVSYTAPDGTPVKVTFVADGNGYQPQSDLLPVAPAFPHPIPQFVLDQIAFAAEEDAARAHASFESSEEDEAPSRFYGSPI